jgi:hypothetical protein
VNCILDGNNSEELSLDTAPVSGQINQMKFINNMLKTQIGSSNLTRFINNKINQSPSFRDPGNKDFRLNSNSPAINYGIQLPTYQTDLNGILRDQSPDLGAYEFFP